MPDIRIIDIHAGKPDANDEVEDNGYQTLLENFIAPSNFNFDKLLNDSFYYIVGYKGTGKTALLYYLDFVTKNIDQSSCSSFIFFKSDYSDLDKDEFSAITQYLKSSISISKDIGMDGQDFEFIWRWLFYQRILDDNEANDMNLFVEDDNWNMFKKSLQRVEYTRKKRKLYIPKKIRFATEINDPMSSIKYKPEFELDFSEPMSNATLAYRKFVDMINELDEIFPLLSKTDTPYYIFVDELEAYYGQESIFLRDLKLIRDLIFTIKKLNTLMSSFNTGKAKIICSVRTEILNAINRFIVSKELNKITSGYQVPLIWDYTNTNSYEHPIIKILTKKISIAESKSGNVMNDREIVQKWFPEKIDGIDASNHILNNSWCKPRDIVRLISSAQGYLCSNNTSFNASTFNMLRRTYSDESLKEIKQEMQALYSIEQIETIFSCFIGFRYTFSISDLQKRIDTHFCDTILAQSLVTILRDLYRLGVIGNYAKATGSYRWHHKGNDGLIISEDWSIMIHYALRNALSVSERQDNRFDRASLAAPQAGEIVDVVVNHIVTNYIIVTFIKGNNKYTGSIHVSQLSKTYIRDIFTYTSVGEKIRAVILGYDQLHGKWRLSSKEIDQGIKA